MSVRGWADAAGGLSTGYGVYINGYHVKGNEISVQPVACETIWL